MGGILTDVDEMYLAWSSLKQKLKKHRKAMSNTLWSTNYILSSPL